MKLSIKNFKCFVDVSVDLNQLTILAGANGNGKSTIVQALLFLKKTIHECAYLDHAIDRWKIEMWKDNRIALNGGYCLSLGNSNYVLNRNFTSNQITIGLENANSSLEVFYEVDLSDSTLSLNTIGYNSKGLEDNFPLIQKHFYYLNAERIGPRVKQSMEFTAFPHAGWKGENTAQLINLENGRYKVDTKRRYDIETPEHKAGNKPMTRSLLITDQVNAWLDFIMPGVIVKVSQDPNTLSTQVLIENEFTRSEPTLSTNLGFGISYVLPIIATGLVAKTGSLFVVENPEAHLHPSAQSRIGRFLAAIASAGVNVVIETHSDHVINGFQIAVAERRISPELVTINFLSNKKDEIQPEVEPLAFNEKGELSKWPAGFFDQTQNDYSTLHKLRRNV